jgi:hypothetical protein
MTAYEEYHSYAGIRWHTFQARSHTMVYAGIVAYGEARRDRKILCVFGRIVYTISLLEAHTEYARGTPDVRYSYTGNSRDGLQSSIKQIPSWQRFQLRHWCSAERSFSGLLWVTKGEDVPSFHNGSSISLLCMGRAYTNRTRLENDMDRIIDVFGQRSHRASHFFWVLTVYII